jgi:carbon monoxide dehydrogenase subunit G
MIHIEESITINCPIEDVFAFVSDFRNVSQWQSGVVDVRLMTEGPVGVGTRATFVRVFLGRKLETIVEMVEFKPPTKQVFKTISGPMPGTVSRRFEPTAEGTTVSMVIEGQAGGIFALAEPLVARSLSRGVKAAFGDLKDLLENRTVEVSS